MLRIVYATDMGYLMPTRVAASSALAWASDRSEIAIHVLDCGIEDSAWEEFARALRTRFGESFALYRHSVDMSRFGSLQGWTNGSKGTYARLDIPCLLPDADWCVYADGDTLFTDDPLKLKDIWKGDCALMGHLDPFDASQPIWHRERNLPWHDETHVCCGFLLLNLEWFRAHDVTGKCLEFLHRYPDCPCVDQDALNVVCENHIKLLPDEWGVLAYTLRGCAKGGCLHYGNTPPWKNWRPYSRHHRVLIPSSRRLWLLFAGRVLNRRPWQIVGCSAWDYFRASALTWISIQLMRVLNVIPLKPPRHRYDRGLQEVWSRGEIRALLPGGFA